MTLRNRAWTALVLAATLLVPAASAQTAAPPAARKKAAPAPAGKAAAGARRTGHPVLVTSVEGITEYALDNGLHVLLFPDQTKQTITVNITYLVGSRHENYGETGMAHLLEHLMFKGTPKHPNVPQELTSHGARPNGTTWFDRTNYFETFQASDENLTAIETEFALDPHQMATLARNSFRASFLPEAAKRRQIAAVDEHLEGLLRLISGA